RRLSSSKNEIKRLDRKPKLDHVAILHDVVFTLHPGLALGTRFSDRAGFNQVVKRDHFSFNETFFEVSVNHTGSLRSLPPLTNRPRTSLFRASCEISLQPERFKTNTCKLIKPAFVLTDRLKHFSGVFFAEFNEFT